MFLFSRIFFVGMRPVECCSFFSFLFFQLSVVSPIFVSEEKGVFAPVHTGRCGRIFLRFFYGTRRRKRFVYSVDRKKEKKRKRGLFLGAPFRVEFFGRRSTVAEIGKWDIENQSKR